ncbi:hypothetical protein QBC38DRAFT_457983 [Podospora fimiseda]|uniref:UspA domain-containing protein n=1 Tax=Podospora fimiseda TaxID=252190 RepID=A0AAN7BK65_9PEZI|nr:hypothetical protein QBC38DRAFT_457983 [Podospora fimiseda]
MAGQITKNNVTALNTSSPLAAAKSPDSDVSPHTKSNSDPADYFSHGSPASGVKTDGAPGLGAASAAPPIVVASSGASTAGTTATTSSSTSGSDGLGKLGRASHDNDELPTVPSRKSSSASVTFRPPRNPSLPQGIPRKTDNRRLRESSPEPRKFKPHVGFDNLPVGEATKNNPSSLVLQTRHQGYQRSRRSRTFMIGVDEHSYSDYALVWLLNNMVDDGDEVVCVRVMESPVGKGEKAYQEDAKKLLEGIQAKNERNKAISLILEYSVGKLHDTFQQLLSMYNPSMLVVGTKGRSLGGIQGLMSNRNSFSKYCLQYSPIPVVVVRPDDKRQKKKEKRTHDPNRQSYAAMLAHNAGKHEVDSEGGSIYELETSISPDEEAHRVAAAIGLPARFDPTIKPYTPPTNSRRSSPVAGVRSPLSAGSTSASRSPETTRTESGDEESDNGEEGDDDEEFEVEAVSAQPVLARKNSEIVKEQEQKERLHRMEQGEAAALLKHQAKEAEEEEDEDESREKTNG